MKDILGHRSWNRQELMAILRRDKSFTMCDLPHYRFNPVKEKCRRLASDGWIERAGYGENTVIWKVTDKWKAYHNGSDLV